MPVKFYEVNLTNFIHWLELFDPDEVVGVALDVNACPLKNYLTTIDPSIHTVWYGTLYLNDDYNTEYKLSAPVQKLIKAIDRYYIDHHNQGDKMTARRVLNIIDELPYRSGKASAKELAHVN